MRIFYSPENLAELFSVELEQIQRWTQKKVIPVVKGCKPPLYDKEDIDNWLASGGLEICLRQDARGHDKGVYGSVERRKMKPDEL